MSTSENPILKFLAETDPGRPPGAGQYVARPKSIQTALEVGLRPSPTARVLLVGQTGAGKTTEIRALVESAFANEFTIIAPPVDEDLDIGLAEWLDFLVYAAGHAAVTLDAKAGTQLAGALKPREEKVVREQVPDPEEEVARALKRLGGFGRLGGSSTPTFRERTVASGGPPEPTIPQRFRNDADGLHRHLASAPAQFWDLAVGVLRAAEAGNKGRPILVVLDGLEKLPVERARYLFGQLGTTLTRWPCRLLVTGPLGMTAEPWFAEADERLSSVEHLRAISCLPGEPGTDFFVTLAAQRGALEVMDEADVRDQISWSGGLPRQFLQLLTRAAQDAAAAGLSRVPPEFHHRARHRLAQRFQYQLEPQDMKALNEPEENRTKEQKNRLLRVGALIEYDRADGSFVVGLNPLVGLLLKRRPGVET